MESLETVIAREVAELREGLASTIEHVRNGGILNASEAAEVSGRLAGLHASAIALEKRIADAVESSKAKIEIPETNPVVGADPASGPITQGDIAETTTKQDGADPATAG